MTIEKLIPPLQISNAGNLSIFFVGVGSAFSKLNYQNNVIVIKGNDHLLIDCGTLCATAFYNYKSNIAVIKNILPTHSHADHIGGLEEVALAGRFITKTKPNVIITDEYKDILWNQSLKGGCSYSELENGTFMSFDDYFTQIVPEEIKGTPRPMYHTKIGDIDIKLFRTKHIPSNASSWENSFYSLGALIDDRILFSSDTRFDTDLLDWLCSSYNIEYIFHDCQFYNGGVHAGYDELKTLPAEMKSKMILCHYGDTFEKFTPEADGFLGFAKQGYYYNFD